MLFLSFALKQESTYSQAAQPFNRAFSIRGEAECLLCKLNIEYIIFSLPFHTPVESGIQYANHAARLSAGVKKTCSSFDRKNVSSKFFGHARIIFRFKYFVLPW